MHYLSLLAFLEKGLRFQSSVFNCRHDILMMSFGINNIAILDIHCICCFIYVLSLEVLK